MLFQFPNLLRKLCISENFECRDFYFDTFSFREMIKNFPSPEQIDINISRLESGESLSQLEKDAIKVILETAHELGSNIIVRAVGGWVRNKLLGIDAGDLDLAVENVTGDEFGKKLQSHFPKNHQKYQTIIEYDGQPSVLWVAHAVIFDNYEIDVCRLRTEEFPDVPPSENQGTPEEDSNGRDFTINSIFLNFNTMKIEDFSNGINDLKNRVLKTYIDAERKFSFEMNSLIRAFRFAVIFDFEMSEEIKTAIRKLKQKYIEKAPKNVCMHSIIKSFDVNIEISKKVLELINDFQYVQAIFDPKNVLDLNFEQIMKNVNELKEENQTPMHILAAIYKNSYKSNKNGVIETIQMVECNKELYSTIIPILEE
ncbi:tRNA nucleotidyltransferase-polyA polymerase [Tritrichomonas foetus]|uniref:tRNA nucleotidyltransferase-polyA polymerase n=1 Tax=Tritrichomonas foetus TaxID=1144522 RepID=A0A1J4KS50_9EUKA|nr:tRNA nucleotidyltransferase-polyA polymerase [Tritrichomonas foetus]|eukprot:OHT14091.1 tRNA nucleotidyltransferase-polyA polymerase [Tritrichomonas foetus]